MAEPHCVCGVCVCVCEIYIYDYRSKYIEETETSAD